MSVSGNVRSVAKYESKLLMRSWFYRVFLILAVLFLCIFNFAVLISGDAGGFWLMKALPSNIPYVNLLLLNTGQAIIAVFLSSEFLKSDKKLDTSEVFYVHSLSNAEYVIGKIWGNMNVFFRLDLIIIVIVVIFNLASGVSVDWAAYIVYFFLICVPTLIYIFGLSVSLMLIIKNQAITFVILLGYIALTLFYIEDKFYYLFDYMVYNLPLVKSSMVGFTNWAALINHRLIYLLLGLGFICISIFLFRRLPNTKYGRYRWLVLSFCFILAGCIAAYNHVSSILEEAKMRNLYTEVNNKYVNLPKMIIDHYDISVEQHPEMISAEVVMKGVALESSPVFAFCLNPSLLLREIRDNQKELSFDREHQIILIDFGRNLLKGDTALFTMKYDGRIDDIFCYLDIPAEILQQEYSNNMFRIDKKYSFQSANYLLFTPETYWYPRPGTSYSSDSPDWQQAYFSHFRLTVKTINGLKALSQGTQKWPPAKKPVVARTGRPKRTREKPAGEERSDSIGALDTISGRKDLAVSDRKRPEGETARDSESGDGRARRGGGERSGGSPREGRLERGVRRGEGRPERGARREDGFPERGARREEERPEGGARGARREEERPEGGARRGEGRTPGGNAESGSERGERRERSVNMEGSETGKIEHAVDENQDIAPHRDTERDDIGNREINDEEAPVVPETKDSLFIFETDFPSPSITLIIGDYEQKCIDVDSTLFSIWHLKGHDYFTSAFDSIMDTIPAQIRERRRSLESAYSLDYSFNRFSLVETPVQFYSYVRTWTQAQEKMQPEMILFPEKGCLFDNADVVKRVKNEKRWAKWNGQDISDDEAAIRALNNFMWTFQRTESDFNWSQERGSVNVTVKANPYFVFPQLYNFRYNIFSSEWPIANRLIELYLQDKSDNNTWIRQMNGISNNEKANLLMEQRPFKELLSDTEQRDLLDNVISLKANYLFAPAERNIGYKEYRDSLRVVLQRNIFTNLRFENLLDTMGAIAGEDLITPLEAWNYPTPLPVYIVGAPEVTHISNRDKEVYVVKLQITNDSDNDGVINVETNIGGRNDVYDPRAKRKVSFAAHETKRLVSVWDEAPRNINVNTLISANLPNLVNLPVSNIIRERNKPIDEERDFVLQHVSYNIPGEIIVDNEDSLLFVLSEPDVVGLLPRWLDQVDDNSFRYSGISNWRPPLQWTLTTNDKYYGTHVRSAYVIKSGSGSQSATWKIPVPVAGQYDLYYYVYKQEDVRRGRRGGGGGGGGGGDRGGNGDTEYHFTVKYDEDEEHAYIDLRRSDEGWGLLGTYYFSQDTVRVILTNDCKLRSVVADAVKIVRR
ncbi:MAG: xanthan lyase [Tannerella sp.]|jgi:ABC-type transport system involved in multi-copper enzyme maturation permease subunit|nr:xanthan lyase [Tannerella sp.]